MSEPRSTRLVFRPTRIGFLGSLYRYNPFDPSLWMTLSLALCEPTLSPGNVGWAVGGTPCPRLDSFMPELLRGVTEFAQDLARDATAEPAEMSSYQGAALYCLWVELAAPLQRLIDRNEVEVPFYDSFVARYRFLFGYPGNTVPEPAHLLALFYQARRAWFFAASRILGRSRSAGAARMALWRANMGGDVCAYAESLYAGMDEVPVLITGETGTGKDLAAECIGWSRYIPFDVAARRFARKYDDDFHIRNLCEVPNELLASSLFGHKRGSFTGAAADATGFFALAKRYGTLVLDEAGELPSHLQAMLLRPLQNRTHVRLGENEPREILGRLVFATNRDLEAMVHEGTFRRDLLERMKGIHIRMPSLRQILAEAPDELGYYVRAFIAKKGLSPARVEELTERMMRSLVATRRDYPWPGNLRELEKETGRFLLGEGVAEESVPEVPPVEAPSPPAEAPSPATDSDTPESVALSSGILGPNAKAGKLSVDQVVQALVTEVFATTGESLAETARLIRLDPRTVARKIDRKRLARLRKRSKKK